jgi:hypothetical protein
MAEECDAKQEQALTNGDLAEAELQRKLAAEYRESERGLRAQAAR